jgi:hypothetical protein
VALSPQANYTDWATAACGRSKCQLLRIEGVAWSAQRIPWPLIRLLNRLLACDIWASPSRFKINLLLGCEVVYFGKQAITCHTNLLPPPLGLRTSNWKERQRVPPKILYISSKSIPENWNLNIHRCGTLRISCRLKCKWREKVFQFCLFFKFYVDKSSENFPGK